MYRTRRSLFAWLALLGIVVSGSLAATIQPRDLDAFGQGWAHALPPPDLCCLCPILEKPTIELSFLSEFDALDIDDGYRFPLASRAPPQQA